MHVATQARGMLTAESSTEPLALPQLLAELKVGLAKAYGPRLRGVYLFGSRARGDAGPDSDVDVAIVLDEIPHYASEIARTSSLVAALSLRYGVSLSRVFVSEPHWQAPEGPFLLNASEEAIPA